MITQTESGLTQAAYDKVKAGLDGNTALHATSKFTVQRRNFKFDTSVVTGLGDTNIFDACIDSSYIYLAYVSSGTLYIKQYDLSAGTWGSAITIDTSVASIPPSFGDDDTLFYVKTNNDVGKATRTTTWSSASTSVFWQGSLYPADINDVIGIAATNNTTVYFAFLRHNYNTEFYVLDASGRNYTYLYWPHRIDSVDAVRISGTVDKDLVVFSSELPYHFGLKAKGTTVEVMPLKRRGVVGFHATNKMFSDHFIIEEFDEASDYQTRLYPRASLVNDRYVVGCYGIDGNENYNHAAHRVYFSGDGKNFQIDEPFQLSGSSYGTKLLYQGDYVYLVTRYAVYRSYATELIGVIPSAIQEDITENVLSAMSSSTGIRSTSLKLSNADGWYSSSILSEEGKYSLTIKLGYYDGGNQLVQVSHEIIDSIEPSENVPEKTLDMVSRDYGALLADVQSPSVREADSQILGADKFWDNTGTGYGGLRHTAGIDGYWSTPDGALQLRSSNKTGVATTTFGQRIWNGSIQAKINWATADNGEFVGLVFRCYDKDNYWRVIYDADEDKLKVQEIRGGDLSSTSSSSAMGWSLGNTYYLKVVFWYHYVRVYASTDGTNWTFQFSRVQNGHVPSSVYTRATVPLEVGSCGYVGYGYSDTDTWDDWDWGDDPYDEPGDAGYNGSGLKSAIVGYNVILDDGSSTKCGVVAYTRDLVNGPWADLMSGLPTASTARTNPLRYINLDFHDAEQALVFFQDGGMYRNASWKTGGSWTSMVTSTEFANAIATAFPSETLTDLMMGNVAMSMVEAGTFYVMAIWDRGTAKRARGTVVKISNYGATISVLPYKIVLGNGSTVTTSIHEDMVIACSTVDAGIVYMVSGCPANSGIAKNAGFWELDFDNPTTWYYPSWSENVVVADQTWSAAPEYSGMIFVPYYAKDGSVNNPENELYITVDDDRTYRSLNGGTSWAKWTADDHYPAGDLHTGYRGGPDHFETAGQHNGSGFAYFLMDPAADPDYSSETSLYVLASDGSSTVKGNWTRYALPSNNVGWLGGWPFNGGQFYIGLGQPYATDFESGSALLYYTTNPAGGFTDITHNLQSLSSWTSGVGVLSARIIRMTPHWGET